MAKPSAKRLAPAAVSEMAGSVPAATQSITGVPETSRFGATLKNPASIPASVAATIRQGSTWFCGNQETRGDGTFSAALIASAAAI
jgi:hypothetical protein